MRLKDIIEREGGNIFDVIRNDELVAETADWSYYSCIKINALIGVGWLSNDDILLINTDGEHIYDIIHKSIIFEDYDCEINANFSSDNLSYFSQNRDENVNIFGLRGGGGSLQTKEFRWLLELINISWEIKIPKLTNLKSGAVYYIETQQNKFEGYRFIGFSKSENFFLIFGDAGVDVYKKKIISASPLS